MKTPFISMRLLLLFIAVTHLTFGFNTFHGPKGEKATIRINNTLKGIEELNLNGWASHFSNYILNEPSSSITSFKFEVKNNNGKISEDIICDIYGDSLIVGIIPSNQLNLQLVPTFTTSSSRITVNEVEQQSEINFNDFSAEVYYKVFSGEISKTYKVKLVYTGLPVVYVNTENAAPIVSKDNYVNGEIKIYSNLETEEMFSAPMEIKGRGNSTWSMPKKPYKVKLKTKASILNMPEDKEWVLLANYADKTLLRNYLALELGRNSNLPYTPRMRHVDLVLNGVYQGNYLLGEQVKVSKGRINIKELDENDTEEEKITGGYFLEVDARLDEDFWFITSRGVPFTIKSPDDIIPDQFNYIKNYIQETEDVLFSETYADPVNGYSKYLNIETFIDWYWINELFKNNDASFFSSVNLYKDRNGKLNMGPLWDFDIGAGNINYSNNDNPSGWWIRNAAWMDRLFTDPSFKQAAEDRWNELKGNQFLYLIQWINNKAEELDRSQELNFYKWDILNSYVWPNPVVTGSYPNEVEYLKKWLQTRTIWIDAQINTFGISPGFLSNPLKKSTFEISEGSNASIKFIWKGNTPGAHFRLVVDTLNGDFTKPLLSRTSDFYGYDSIASVPVADFIELLKALNIKDTLSLKWDVYSYLNSDSLASRESFRIKLVKKVPAPALIFPVHEEEHSGLSPSFKWLAVNDAESYDLQVSLSEDFSDLVLDVAGIQDTSYMLNDLLAHETVYYWRVKAKAAEPIIESEWSTPWKFIAKESLTVGIEESFNKVSIYPNPANSELMIIIPDHLYIDEVEIYDLVGRVITHNKIHVENRKVVLDVGSLPRGSHIILFKQKSGIRLKERIVLK